MLNHSIYILLNGRFKELTMNVLPANPIFNSHLDGINMLDTFRTVELSNYHDLTGFYLSYWKILNMFICFFLKDISNWI